MTLKILRLFQLISYLLVTSQVLFYLIAFSDALKFVSLDNFLDQRKAVEEIIAGRFKILYYLCLALSICMIIQSARSHKTPLLVSTIIATICLIIDILIALKGNIPINTTIRISPAELDLMDWEVLKNDWLNFFRYRGLVTTIGMLSLLVGLLWENDLEARH